MLLNTTLLEATTAPFAPTDFNSCLNARGSYESQRFVLRLNPVIHELVNGIVDGAANGSMDFTEESLQAYSTYVHETVHWWQHKGSTSGLIRSMLFPTQTHGNIESLRELMSLIGPKKSIQAVALDGELGKLADTPGAGELANVITNNFMDTEFFLALTHKPDLDVTIYDNPYFEAAGHSFLVTYGHVLGALKGIFDPTGLVLPNPEPINDNLLALRERKVDGYYYASPIFRPPVGLLHIMEGQARFIQVQFLNFAGDGIKIADMKSSGLLEREYGEAFKKFLELTESTEPEMIHDPLVALFLLICDLSLNPTAGFPSQIVDYEYFFLDADPGARFTVLCRAVAEAAPELRQFITDYSREQYLAAVDLLSKAAGLDNLMTALAEVEQWEHRLPEVAHALEEHRNFKFSPSNVVPRVLFAEFIEFTKDKLRRPEFFCWAGYWMSGGHSGQEERELWLKNLSLFSDKQDDGGVFGRVFPGCTAKDTKDTTDQFYAAVIIYDLSRQWVLRPGPFRLDFQWLTRAQPQEEFNAKVKDLFHRHYGVHMDDFELVPLDFPRVDT